MGFFFSPNYNKTSGGKPLTGFSKYLDILERNFKKFFFSNLMTLVCFLPFALGVLFAILSSSILILIPACVIGGILAGPALSCMYDTILRSLRDAPGKWWSDYKRALQQNWKQSIVPGILFCLLLGIYIFMAMLFWWAVQFPGIGTIAIYICSLLLFTMFFSILWPQIVLFEQPTKQSIKNCLLFMLRYLPKTAGIALLQLAYWLIIALFLPWSVVLLPLIGFWFILYSANFLIYGTFNTVFGVDEKIADAFPEQAPYYEDDETWLKRKEEERNASANTNS